MAVWISSYKPLIDKLNPTCQKTLNSAVGLSVSLNHAEAGVEHWLVQLLENDKTDVHRILKHYQVPAARATAELMRALEKERRGGGKTSASLSNEIANLMQEAWSLASLEYGAARIRSGHILTALLTERHLRGSITEASPSLGKIPGEELQKNLAVLLRDSAEDPGAAPVPAAGAAAPGPGQPALDSKTPALDQFTYNLTERARKGEIDPVIGRDFEIRQVIDILTRRRQNNPILTGEAGVGKTAVVEGFALKIVAGDVPPPLRNVALRTLDLGLLQAGAGVKGEFENRLKSVIAEVKASPQPIVLFIDEAHTIIGAGGQAGQGDAANLLKPALARGELRTVAATTWTEYKKYFEADPALKRRFQVVKVDEPDVAKGVLMMRGLVATLEKHHGVRILDEAVEEAVKLSHRYIADRQLPDKSVSLLDTSCARVALSHTAMPWQVEDCRREIEALDVEGRILERESALGADHRQRLDEVAQKKAAAQERLAALDKRWQDEKKLADQMKELRTKLEAHLTPAPAGGAPAAAQPARLSPEEEQKCRQQLAQAERQLAELQGESPLVLPVVNGQAIAEVVSGWTGIPAGKMVLDEIKTVLSLKERLEERVVGQGYALEALAQRIRTSRAGLSDPRRPIGVFFMVGPSGVGKTETALALADLLYGGDRNLVVVNMSEYKEEYKVSQLIGSPRGYEGSQEGGVLTEAVRRRPYSVVLLDEVEKSHPSVQEIFYQAFDKGMLSDSRGIEVDFKNTIIILTSNVGTETIMKVCADPDTRPDAAGLAEALRPDLLKVFKPALLGRMFIVPYFPLGDDVLRKIIQLKLKQIVARVRENHRAELTYDDAVVTTVASRCKEVESGARNVDHILTGTMLPELAADFLARMAAGTPVRRANVGVSPEGKFTYTVE